MEGLNRAPVCGFGFHIGPGRHCNLSFLVQVGTFEPWRNESERRCRILVGSRPSKMRIERDLLEQHGCWREHSSVSGIHRFDAPLPSKHLGIWWHQSFRSHPEADTPPFGGHRRVRQHQVLPKDNTTADFASKSNPCHWWHRGFGLDTILENVGAWCHASRRRHQSLWESSWVICVSRFFYQSEGKRQCLQFHQRPEIYFALRHQHIRWNRSLCKSCGCERNGLARHSSPWQLVLFSTRTWLTDCGPVGHRSGRWYQSFGGQGETEQGVDVFNKDHWRCSSLLALSKASIARTLLNRCYWCHWGVQRQRGAEAPDTGIHKGLRWPWWFAVRKQHLCFESPRPFKHSCEWQYFHFEGCSGSHRASPPRHPGHR